MKCGPRALTPELPARRQGRSGPCHPCGGVSAGDRLDLGVDAAARGKPRPARYPGRHDRPQRIVSLLPSATDLLFELLTDLGLAGRVVGVSHSCDHPRARHPTPGTGQRR